MPGPARKPDALRRNPEHRREMLRKWREANPEQCQQTRKRNNASREERYRKDPAYYLWRTARWRAKATGQEFSIGPEDVVVPERCPITQEPLSILAARFSNGASLDRVDNSKGYVKGNVRVISRRANRMKGDATESELLRILAYMRGEI